MSTASAGAASVSPDRPAAVIVLAAGEGTRMKSRTPKVLHRLGGRTMVGHALRAARGVEPEHLVVVVGHGREEVTAHLAEIDELAGTALQSEQNGTGHAVQCALATLPQVGGQADQTVLVTYGDVPLLTAQTLRDLLARHRSEGNAVTVLTAEVPDPTGYGRIIRAGGGAVTAIREHKDATPQELAVREINSGIFAFDAAVLCDALTRIGTDNVQGELYLTDVVEIAHGDGRAVGAHLIDDVWQTEGINDRVQLSRLGAELNRRIVESWMGAGVTVVDPATTWIDDSVELATDVTVLPGVQLHGDTRIAAGAVLGPDSSLRDVVVGEDAQVIRTHGTGAEIGPGAVVGPFSYLRPGTRLGAEGKIGAFVETKNATIGVGSKVPHLSYVGDATIGERSNIGAGTIFANYDGVSKHSTVVGDHCRTGSDNCFVAPVRIGDGAHTGAGTVVRSDIPPGALAVSRGVQRNLEGWVVARRPGSAAAAAAQAAGQSDAASVDD